MRNTDKSQEDDGDAYEAHTRSLANVKRTAALATIRHICGLPPFEKEYL